MRSTEAIDGEILIVSPYGANRTHHKLLEDLRNKNASQTVEMENRDTIAHG